MTVGQHPNFDAALVALVALVRALVDALVALLHTLVGSSVHKSNGIGPAICRFCRGC